MEIKEKAYFEIYQDDKLMSQGVGENMKFSGNFIRVEYLPKSYTYTTQWGNTYEIPSYIIQYYSEQIHPKEDVALLTKEEFNNIMNIFSSYSEGNTCEKL